MCGRFTNTAGPEEIGRQLGKPLGVRIARTAGTGRYRINPTDSVLAIVAREGAPEARMLRWALLPASAKTTATKKPWINAPFETLRDKGQFIGVAPKATHRGLIVADGFYEWPKSEDKGAKPKLAPPPFRFQVDDGQVFGFAGLWVTSPHVEGGPVESCAIITCEASHNRVVSPVHDRMPVILADLDAMQTWLNPSVSPKEALALCKPLAADRLCATLASQAVNNVKLPEGPELLIASAKPSTDAEARQLSLS
jgi:putative SOS response-associated peptidase YedK